MKYFLPILLFIIVSHQAFANQPVEKAKKAQISCEDYIAEYGTDATSIAIIELFFNKRNKAGLGQMSFLPVGAGVTVVAFPLGLFMVAMSTPLFVNGLMTRHKYSLKNLTIALDNYKSNKLLSNRFKKKVNRIIEENNETKQQAIEETNYLALKQIKPIH